MKIIKDEIIHVAKLSRLEFNAKEIDKFTEQMGEIINMANQLGEVNTDGVEETVQVVDRDTVFRADEPEHWQSKAELMKNVPDKVDGFIKVPVIIDKDDNA